MFRHYATCWHITHCNLWQCCALRHCSLFSTVGRSICRLLGPLPPPKDGKPVFTQLRTSVCLFTTLPKKAKVITISRFGKTFGGVEQWPFLCPNSSTNSRPNIKLLPPLFINLRFPYWGHGTPNSVGLWTTCATSSLRQTRNDCLPKYYEQWNAKRLLHATTSIAIARICYGNSVLVSVTSRYRSKTMWDRDFGFSPYGSLDSVVFRYKISCRWVKGVPTKEEAKGECPSFAFFVDTPFTQRHDIFCHKILETLSFHIVKILSLYLTWSWNGTGTWQTPGQNYPSLYAL